MAGADCPNRKKGGNAMQDVIEVKDGRLIVNVAIDAKGVQSKSGKSMVNFSTKGNVKLESGFIVGINLYK